MLFSTFLFIFHFLGALGESWVLLGILKAAAINHKPQAPETGICVHLPLGKGVIGIGKRDLKVTPVRKQLKKHMIINVFRGWP